ncbi:exosortase T [Actibacterium lipolyticum]|uniref:Transmembrane exosortase (Exosortase_EpsH) n=1 Tax=Actibacterium lipolyticum TaxID=1524263 RepID=A0A238KV41_9RHOB|nr:exosortase T [Actibacterium lipolyticum]SMX46567.1 Transmembrane exosortase (Exosortase_EpsH) [Actibacterium lipolyticum]
MEQKHDTPLWIGLTLASAMLAIEPIKWLMTSWRDPSYQSYGAFYCVVIAGLIGLSLAHKPAAGAPPARRAFAFFLVAAACRLGGQMLAINILSALALAIDVFALATFFRLDQRKFALSPLWLAVFFLFALPLGPILQRVAGFPMQIISAELACGMLSPFFPDLLCEGVRLQISGHDVLVDLPCSGASGLLLMVSLWAFLNVLYRPRLIAAITGGVAIVAVSILGNGLRISLLASGLALGVDTMEPVLHEGIGLLSLALSVLPVMLTYRPKPAPISLRRTNCAPIPRRFHVPVVLAALCAAMMILNAPRKPVDRSKPVANIEMPVQLLGYRGQSVALSDTERTYFTTYGGTAQKVQFGPLGVNVVRTGSPLRHLHSPATCLLGMGFDVRFLGTRFDPIPTSVYEATGPDGRVWTVAVSFVSENGHKTASVGEAVWSWLNGSSRNWQSIQRITPKNLPADAQGDFETAVLAALDI